MMPESIIVARYAIYVLLAGVLVFPIRYAFVCLLLLGFFDASGGEFASASSVGLANSLKVLLAPLILSARMRFMPFKILLIKKNRESVAVYFLIFVYVALAISWSNWRLSGLKTVGYLLGHLIWFAVIAYGWISGRLTTRIISIVFLSGILLGIIQSYLLEPSFGVYLYEKQRFTAFLSPQYYAALFVFLTAILLFDSSKMWVWFIVLLISLSVIFLTGSRYSFLGWLALVGMFVLYILHRKRSHSYVVLVTAWSFMFGVVVILLLSGFGYEFPWKVTESTRIGELRYLFTNPEQIGTLAWRIGMYNVILEKLSNSSLFSLLFGHGTASGAEVTLSAFPSHYTGASIDANRVIHNEFLRSFYEWGVIGLIVISYLLFILLTIALHGLLQKRQYGYLLAAVLPFMILGLLIENVLAGAGSAWGIGIALVLGKVYKKRLYERNFP